MQWWSALFEKSSPLGVDFAYVFVLPNFQFECEAQNPLHFDPIYHLKGKKSKTLLCPLFDIQYSCTAKLYQFKQSSKNHGTAMDSKR